jgi:hypothetical protein
VTDQLTLDTATCKVRGCTAPIVGQSITGKGYVCKRHNEAEWGRALMQNPDSYYGRLGQALRRDSEAP